MAVADGVVVVGALGPGAAGAVVGAGAGTGVCSTAAGLVPAGSESLMASGGAGWAGGSADASSGDGVLTTGGADPAYVAASVSTVAT